jgi:hypothetical protein
MLVLPLGRLYVKHVVQRSNSAEGRKPWETMIELDGLRSASRPCRFTPRGRNPLYSLYRRLGRSQSQSGRCGEDITDITRTRTPTPWSSSPVAIPIALPPLSQVTVDWCPVIKCQRY